MAHFVTVFLALLAVFVILLAIVVAMLILFAGHGDKGGA